MPEEKESSTGVVIPSSATADSPASFASVLDAVAMCCTRHLSKGGYFSGHEADAMLGEYRLALSGPTPEAHGERDFLVFTAEAQARTHNLVRADEIRRMQKVLRWSVADRVPLWTFGALPGRSDVLVQAHPWLRLCCRQLSCPAVTADHSEIIHVASINPVAVLVCAAAIEREAVVSEGASPVVFPIIVDLPTWEILMQRHLPP